MFKNNKKGFTLVEMLMYVAIMTIVGSVIVVFIPQLTRKNAYIQAKGEVLDNMTSAMEIMAREIKHSSSIYASTTVFAVNPGQLSLETSYNTIATEDTTFVDFYVDNNRLYVKREEQTAELLTSNKIKITSLVFTNLNANGNYPVVRIVMTASYNSTSQEVLEQSRVTLTSTVSARDY